MVTPIDYVLCIGHFLGKVSSCSCSNQFVFYVRDMMGISIYAAMFCGKIEMCLHQSKSVKGNYSYPLIYRLDYGKKNKNSLLLLRNYFLE